MLSKGLFMSRSEEWATPQKVFDALDSEFHFTLDPCASDLNHKCDKYYTIAENGLLQNWEGEMVFCNPPYGRKVAEWAKKCSQEGQKKKTQA